MIKSDRYKQIAAEIETKNTFEDLELMRAAIFAYQKQKGGVGLQVVLEVGELTKLISDKQHDINKEER
tara:strand:- start:928 stop:1131 length:204 start_codon:yes stop_codon:yes gene_type:complete